MYQLASSAAPSLPYLLVPGSNWVGRDLACKILLKDELSVSRRHAEFVVSSDGKRVTITDFSTVGTKLNEQGKIAKNEPVELEPRSILRFGEMAASFSLLKEPLVLHLTNASEEEKARYKALCRTLGVLDSAPYNPDSLTHLIVGSGKMPVSPKMLMTLIAAKPIVTLNWLEEVAKTQRLVSIDDFLPPVEHLATRMERMDSQVPPTAPDFRPNLKRQSLFAGMTVILNDPDKLKTEADILRRGGAANVVAGVPPAGTRNVSVLVVNAKDKLTHPRHYPIWSKTDLTLSILNAHLSLALSSCLVQEKDTPGHQTKSISELETPTAAPKVSLPDVHSISPAPGSGGGPSVKRQKPLLPVGERVEGLAAVELPAPDSDRGRQSSSTISKPLVAADATIPSTNVPRPASNKPLVEELPSSKASAKLAASTAKQPDPSPFVSLNTPPALPIAPPSLLNLASTKSEDSSSWLSRGRIALTEPPAETCKVLLHVPASVSPLASSAPSPLPNFKKFRKNMVAVSENPPIVFLDGAVYSKAPAELSDAFRRMEEDEVAAMEAFGSAMGKKKKVQTTLKPAARRASTKKKPKYEESSEEDDEE